MNTAHVPQRILITGASGFVGRRLTQAFLARGLQVRAALRDSRGAEKLPREVEICTIGDLSSQTDWTAALAGVDTVIHLAARVHVLKERTSDPLEAFRRVNVEATLRLAQAAAGRVRRFVSISSVHAMCRVSRERLDETTPCRPDSPYGVSKWEAEQRLGELAGQTGLPLVVVRPPPVYGPASQGNVMRLFRLVQQGWPLPLGLLNNRRSFVYVENLVDALIACAEHQAAVGQTFLVSDREDVSTAELVRRLGAALGRPARLVKVPLFPLRVAGRVLGKGSPIERLLGSLAVDSGKIGRLLGWSPPHTLDEGLAATARWIAAGSPEEPANKAA